MRVESKVKARNNGFIHFPDEQSKRPIIVPPKKSVSRPEIDAAVMIGRMQARTTPDMVKKHAGELGVSYESLCAIGAAWSYYHNAWAFPMHDGQGNVIGIRLRDVNGRKWAVSGSKSGLIVPRVQPQDLLYVCEGPTDAAAVISLGFFAVGRPDCRSKPEYVVSTARRFGVKRVVVVSDSDGVGLLGSKELVAMLKGFLVKLWTPPVKDIRDYISLGAGPELFRSQVEQMRWVKP
jgi:hypothetical protein